MKAENILYILIFLFCGLFFIGIGIYALKKKTPMHFWSGTSVKPEEIKDVKAYNRANGIMWIVAGSIVCLSGFAPLILDNEVAAIVSTLVMLPLLILMMLFYTKIYNRYKVSKLDKHRVFVENRKRGIVLIGRVVHIGITVSDMDRSLDFYTNILGLSFQGEMTMEGDATDKLFDRKNSKVRVAYLNGSQEVSSPPIELLQFVGDEAEKDRADLHKTSISEVCFHVEDIDKAYEDLKEKGVEFISKPQYFDFTNQGFGKSKAVYFKDPDGIILELLESIYKYE